MCWVARTCGACSTPEPPPRTNRDGLQRQLDAKQFIMTLLETETVILGAVLPLCEFDDQIDRDAALFAVRTELREQRVLKIDARTQLAGWREFGEYGR